MSRNEIWKDIKGYEGKYQVSSLGRIKSLNYKRTKKENIMTPCVVRQDYKNNTGYLTIHLMKNGIRKPYRIHRLVAQTFIPNPNNYPIVNHIDENIQNNCVDNLEWCTNKYNLNYGNAQNNKAQKLNKSVKQYDENGNFINKYISLVQASKETNIPSSYISRCCTGKIKTTKGYIFVLEK